MAELFDVGVSTINHHLGELFESGELARDATIQKFRMVWQEGGGDVACERCPPYRRSAALARGITSLIPASSASFGFRKA